MFEVTADIDLEDVIDGFNDMERKARNLTKVWREIAPDMKKDIREHGRKKEGPDAKWEKLAKSTRAKRKARKAAGRKTAVAILGKIRTSFRIEWGPKFIRGRSMIPWSGAHAEGETVGRGSVLPERTPFFVSEAFLNKLIDSVLKHITRAF